MIKKLVIFSILFLLLLGTGVNADSISVDDRKNIDFGKFTAREELSKDVILEMRMKKKVVALEFWIEDDFSCQGNRYTLPEGRFKVRLGEGSSPIVIGTEHRQISLKTNKRKRIPLVFSLTVNPNDLPGNYETTLHIRKICKRAIDTNDLTNSKPNHLTVRLVVEPWIYMQLKTANIEMSQLTPDFRSISNYNNPGIIQLKANIPWQLTGRLAPDVSKNELLIRNNLEINLEPNNDYDLVYPEGFSLKEAPILLATGGAAVNWIEIPFILKLDDFTRIAAGSLRFSLDFKASRLNPLN